MVTVSFTQNLQRHVASDSCEVEAATLREALDAVFGGNPKLRGYILDDTGAVRKHVAIFINGEPSTDRTQLSDSLENGAEVFVMQALSGG